MTDLIHDPPEGSTPIDDISGLKPPQIKSREQLFAAEFENIRKAVVRYLATRPSRRRAPFSFDWFFTLHKQMFGDVWVWAGMRRNHPTNIGLPVHQIDTALMDLSRDVLHWDKIESPATIEQAAIIHHRAVQIHPFTNGNGRWARMLANIRLKQIGMPVTEWPEQTIGATSIIRAEYLAALRAADRQYLEPLIDLHRKYTPARNAPT